MRLVRRLQLVLEQPVQQLLLMGGLGQGVEPLPVLLVELLLQLLSGSRRLLDLPGRKKR